MPPDPDLGGRNTAVEGIDTLRALVAQAAGRIELMAGSGVNPSNVRQLAATGVDAVHFSARSVRPGGMVFRNPHVSMGGCGVFPNTIFFVPTNGSSDKYLPCSNHETHHLPFAGGVSLCLRPLRLRCPPPDTNRCWMPRWPAARAPTACGNCCGKLRASSAKGWPF